MWAGPCPPCVAIEAVEPAARELAAFGGAPGGLREAGCRVEDEEEEEWRWWEEGAWSKELCGKEGESLDLYISRVSVFFVR